MVRLKIIALLAGAVLLITALLNPWAPPGFSLTEPGETVRLALLDSGSRAGEEGLILASYEQVLQEEGFAYQVVSPGEIAGRGAAGLRSSFEAVVVPETLNAAMPPETAAALSAYVREQGGRLLLALDPGSRLPDGELRDKPLLAGLAGVDYCLPGPGDEALTYNGYWYFPSPAAGRAWGITPGKLDRDHAVSSYSYGRLQFEHTRANNVDAAVASFDRREGREIPVLTRKDYPGGGIVVYANLPLGRCKLLSDDLALRSVLRTFLIDHARLPRLVNAPGGKGGIVFNLHICSGAYNRPLAIMLMHGLFQKDLPFSIHITAGPDTYKLGDQMGFQAESRLRGRPLLEILKKYGEVGSHGGWTHNFFAYNLHYLPQKEALTLLDWNARALEAVTKKKVTEYSAPGGNHPFWVNQHLAEMGIKAYYYAGDIGSSPTHPRLNREFAGPALWAFPITCLREHASLEEMERGRVPPEEVRQWLEDLLEFAAGERSIRMIYTHPTDTRFGIDALKAFEEKALAEQKKGRLTVAPMSSFADFLNRHAQTAWQVRKNGGNGYTIDLENRESLKDITVAVYVGDGSGYTVQGGDVEVVREEGWLYLTVQDDEQKKHLEVSRI